MSDQLVARVPEVSVPIPYLGIFDVTPYAGALLIFLALVAAFFLVHRVLLTRLAHLTRRSTTDFDDALVRMLRGVHGWALVLVALALSLKVLALPGWGERALTGAVLALVLFEAVRAVSTLLDYGIGRFLARRQTAEGESDPQAETAGQMFSLVARIVLWSFGLLFVLSNLGIEITSLIAGLGIGGIAVGLALQSILGDLFGSFAIYFDKPFQVGDFIIVGEHMGTVERIGIKTTRLRALQGEEIVFSNSELTSARVHNYKRMQERRAIFRFGVTYETPHTLAALIPELVVEVFAPLTSVRLERAHFAELGDSALVFEVVYHVLDGDYTAYMDAQQVVNLGLMKVFAREGIAFAYPTQMLHVRTETTS